MDVSDDLLCLFTGQVEERDGSYVIEIPQREVDIGNVEAGEIFRVALLSKAVQMSSTETQSPEQHDRDESEAPIEEGDAIDVEIENMGDQGDGIARVGPGYVVIIPDTKVGERVSVEITDVRENVAFAEVLKRYDQMA